jgi:C-terminal processing protease CtpA/Prc
MKKLLLSAIVLLSLMAACKKDPIKPSDSGVTPAMARDSLYYIMKDWYFWYNLMPTVTKEDYEDPYQLMEAMRYKTLDRWSFILTYDEYMAQLNGTFVGHGFRIGVDDAGKARIAMIYFESPLYAEGVRRGWIVKKINNIDIAPLLISNDNIAYANVIGESKEGVTNNFLFELPDGTEKTISSTKTKLDINTVLLYDTLHLSSGVTGHLVFESFFNPAPQELATAFAFFKANNITDLILDLRYNSGGYLDIAQTLASYIAGNSTSGSVFAKLTYNNRHQERNTPIQYITTAYPLALPRLIVITTRSTASASEDVMNGLAPFVNITSIGDTTNGKPTGMNGFDVGEKYFIFPVTFKIVNAQDQGDFFDGIFPAKVQSDDIAHDFNDREELCLKDAIHFLETGSLSTKSLTQFKRHPQFSERPSWMNNAFIELNRK